MRRSIDTAKSASSIRRDHGTNLRRNSSLSMGNLHEMDETVVAKPSIMPKTIVRKKRRFSLKKFFGKGAKSAAEQTVECQNRRGLMRNIMRTVSRGRTVSSAETNHEAIIPNTPIIRQREQIISSGIIIWEEDIVEDFDEDFGAVARICNARIYNARNYHCNPLVE